MYWFHLHRTIDFRLDQQFSHSVQACVICAARVNEHLVCNAREQFFSFVWLFAPEGIIANLDNEVFHKLLKNRLILPQVPYQRLDWVFATGCKLFTSRVEHLDLWLVESDNILLDSRDCCSINDIYRCLENTCLAGFALILLCETQWNSVESLLVGVSILDTYEVNLIKDYL